MSLPVSRIRLEEIVSTAADTPSELSQSRQLEKASLQCIASEQHDLALQATRKIRSDRWKKIVCKRISEEYTRKGDIARAINVLQLDSSKETLRTLGKLPADCLESRGISDALKAVDLLDTEILCADSQGVKSLAHACIHQGDFAGARAVATKLGSEGEKLQRHIGQCKELMQAMLPGKWTEWLALHEEGQEKRTPELLDLARVVYDVAMRWKDQKMVEQVSTACRQFMRFNTTRDYVIQGRWDDAIQSFPCYYGERIDLLLKRLLQKGDAKELLALSRKMNPETVPCYEIEIQRVIEAIEEAGLEGLSAEDRSQFERLTAEQRREDDIRRKDGELCELRSQAQKEERWEDAWSYLEQTKKFPSRDPDGFLDNLIKEGRVKPFATLFSRFPLFREVAVKKWTEVISLFLQQGCVDLLSSMRDALAKDREDLLAKEESVPEEEVAALEKRCDMLLNALETLAERVSLFQFLSKQTEGIIPDEANETFYDLSIHRGDIENAKQIKPKKAALDLLRAGHWSIGLQHWELETVGDMVTAPCRTKIRFLLETFSKAGEIEHLLLLAEKVAQQGDKTMVPTIGEPLIDLLEKHPAQHLNGQQRTQLGKVADWLCKHPMNSMHLVEGKMVVKTHDVYGIAKKWCSPATARTTDEKVSHFAK